MNYIIDYSKENFVQDYNLYLKRNHKKALVYLTLALIVVAVVFFFVKSSLESDLVEAALFGLLIFITYFVVLRLYYILTTNRKLEKSKKEFCCGKTNIVFDKTFLEVSKADKKRTIFYSQIKKIVVLDEVMFLVEGKTGYLPLKISRQETSTGAFDQILEKFRVMRIKVEEK